MSDKRICVLFVTRTMGVGGRERQLHNLLIGLDKDLFDVHVLTIFSGGYFADRLRACPGVTLWSLRKSNNLEWPILLARFRRIVRRIKPDIVHGYGMTSNELASLGSFFSDARTIWGLRSLAPELNEQLLVQKVINRIRIRQWLSRHVEMVISNSRAAVASHAEFRYSTDKCIVIPNGIDTDEFRPANLNEVHLQRELWDVPQGDLVIGMAARVEANKGHHVLVEAAHGLLRSVPNVTFLIAGQAGGVFHKDMMTLADRLGLSKKLRWLGIVSNMPLFYSTLDVATVPSVTREGFPNAAAEAMACAVPVVASDIGDSGHVLGDHGYLVPPGDAVSLGNAWASLSQMSNEARRKLGDDARLRISSHFSISVLVERTTAAITGLHEHKSA